MAAKSQLLRVLLFHSGFEEDQTLVVAGSGEMTADEDLVSLLYNPEKSGKHQGI